MNKIVQGLIKLYQFLPKPLAGCRFVPTCSQYTYQAIDKYGILGGGLLSLKRIFKCHPGHKPGYDPLK